MAARLRSSNLLKANRCTRNILPGAGSNRYMHGGLSRAGPGIAAWIFVGFLAIYIALTRGHFYSADEVEVFQQTRSLWERGDLAVAPQINTIPGRDGRYYAQYGIGQTVLAIPFYWLGKQVHKFLTVAGADSGIKIFEGPLIGDPDKRYGGEVEIFFVTLFGAFVMAALMAVFFLFNIRLGASPRAAIAATVILGLTTHVAGFSVEFLQHPAEALFLLLAFYFLFADAARPRARYRWLAGAAASMMILVRASSLILLPPLTVYLLWRALNRSRTEPGHRAIWNVVRGGVDFVIPVLAAIFVTMAVNHAKFGRYSISGSYLAFNHFSNSYLVSFYGWLFSPGQSLFLFSPILLLAPVYFLPFAKNRLPETAAILGLTASYAFFYGLSGSWHGQWCFGPRLLMALVPLLVLPLARWLEGLRPLACYAVVLLAMIGAFVEILHIAVNVSYVHYREGYDNLVPSDAYIFIPQICQLLAHWRALLAHDYRLDMWLVNVGRQSGPWPVIVILALLSVPLIVAIDRISLFFRRLPGGEEKHPETAGSSAAAHVI